MDIESDYPDCVSSVKQDLFSSALYSRKTTDKLHLFCFNDIFVFTLKSDVRKGRDVSKSGINFQYHLVWVEVFFFPFFFWIFDIFLVRILTFCLIHEIIFF